MKRLALIVASILAFVALTAIPAGALYQPGAETGCKRVDTTMTYQKWPPPTSWVTRDAGYQPIDPNSGYPYPYQVVYVAPSEYYGAGVNSFYSDHNIELGNGVRWGFRIYGTNNNSTAVTKSYSKNGVTHHCTWLGVVFTDANQWLLSVTYILDSD